ncbi:hypothetical protein GP486_000405 [Trichoglossum hirsutum]|uniref:Uncharacterized protein n=1 Tax=Trichoglossum hirsutum TaxID=265104 RepID=A0A9P8RTN8_9PEZI|nr:hypothetical protein GP486_000405 [Trichoglossum hirsutum]
MTFDDRDRFLNEGPKRPDGFEKGWAVVEIAKGDILVVTGGFILLTGNMPASVNCLDAFERFEIGNDSLPPQIYHVLKQYIDSVLEETSKISFNDCYKLAVSLGKYQSGKPVVKELVAERSAFRRYISSNNVVRRLHSLSAKLEKERELGVV